MESIFKNYYYVFSNVAMSHHDPISWVGFKCSVFVFYDSRITRFQKMNELAVQRWNKGAPLHASCVGYGTQGVWRIPRRARRGQNPSYSTVHTSPRTFLVELHGHYYFLPELTTVLTTSKFYGVQAGSTTSGITLNAPASSADTTFFPLLLWYLYLFTQKTNHGRWKVL